MNVEQRDPSTLLARLIGSSVRSVERRGFDLEPPLRYGVDPLIVRTDTQALYLTVDGGRGDLLAFELDAVSPGALRGTEPHVLGNDNEDRIVVAALSEPIAVIDRLSRAPGGGPPGFYQFCGIRLALAGGSSLYLGTHLRALVDTDDLCILYGDEIRDDLIATPLSPP
jgi:hypothetical protein